MTPLHTSRLIIRNWQDSDRAVFHEVNSDEKVMEFFQFRRSRAESDAIMDEWRSGIAKTGYGSAAVELKSTGECIGACGLSPFTFEPLFPAGTVEIGWRLAVRHWGKGYVSEAALALMSDGFSNRGLQEIISFAVPANHRSTSVMQRIGMTRDISADFDHPNVSDAHAHVTTRKRGTTHTVRRWQLSQRGAPASIPS